MTMATTIKTIKDYQFSKEEIVKIKKEAQEKTAQSQASLLGYQVPSQTKA